MRMRVHADIPRIYIFLRKFAKSAPNFSEVSVCSGCLFSTTTRLHSLGKLLRMRPSSIGQCRSLSPNTPGANISWSCYYSFIFFVRNGRRVQIFSTQTGITKPHKYSKTQDKSHLSGQNMEPPKFLACERNWILCAHVCEVVQRFWQLAEVVMSWFV